MTKAARAYAHARIRAVKSRLLRRADVLALFCATDGTSTDRALATFGIDPRAELFPQLFARLLAVYRTVMRAHRGDDAIFRALLRRHAIENVKIAWRGPPAAGSGPTTAGGGRRYTRDLEEFEETLDVDTLRDAGELALDRWGSRMLLDAAAQLEPLARQLVECVVRERDAELLRRGPKFYGISEAAARELTLLQREPIAPEPLRRERRKLCRRAFIGHTFELAPSIAVVLLAEEELRGLTALAERRGDESFDDVVERVLLAGAMGEAA